jgi:hypothetical protein
MRNRKVYIVERGNNLGSIDPKYFTTAISAARCVVSLLNSWGDATWSTTPENIKHDMKADARSIMWHGKHTWVYERDNAHGDFIKVTTILPKDDCYPETQGERNRRLYNY